MSLLFDFFDVVSFVVSAQTTLHADAHTVARTTYMSDFVLFMLLAMKKLPPFYPSASKFQFFYQIEVFFVKKGEVFVQKVIRFKDFACDCCLRLIQLLVFGLWNRGLLIYFRFFVFKRGSFVKAEFWGNLRVNVLLVSKRRTWRVALSLENHVYYFKIPIKFISSFKNKCYKLIELLIISLFVSKLLKIYERELFLFALIQTTFLFKPLPLLASDHTNQVVLRKYY